MLREGFYLGGEVRTQIISWEGAGECAAKVWGLLGSEAGLPFICERRFARSLLRYPPWQGLYLTHEKKPIVV